MSEKETQFLGTYFDRGAVIRWSGIIGILAWITAGIYAVDLVVSIGIIGLQVARGFMAGMGPTDWAQQFIFILEKSLHGVLYFAMLIVLSKGLLIALDVEENTRQAARQ